jgi:hypothetical protein
MTVAEYSQGSEARGTVDIFVSQGFLHYANMIAGHMVYDPVLIWHRL